MIACRLEGLLWRALGQWVTLAFYVDIKNGESTNGYFLLGGLSGFILPGLIKLSG